MEIKLNTIKDVQDFVKIAINKCNNNIYAKQNNYVVDAKSIMGLFSLDLLRSFIIEGENLDTTVFKEFEYHGN